MIRPALLRLSVLSLLALAISACRLDPLPGIGSPVPLTLQLSGPIEGVASASVKVSGPQIPDTIRASAPFVNGFATLTLTVPAGNDRRFDITTYDDSGVVTSSAVYVMKTVVAGVENKTPEITLTPTEGRLEVRARIGSISVQLSAPKATATVGEQLQYTAVVTGADGQPVANPALTWGSYNGAIASVDGAGLATAKYPGTTTIVVSYRGFAAAASLAVQQ